MLRKKCFQNKLGSLLIEALLVIVILSVGLTFIIQSLSSSLRALSFSKNYAQAAFLTDNKLSEILLNKTISSGFQDSGDFNGSFKEYHYKISSSSSSLSVDEPMTEPMTQLDLEISWQSGKNRYETSSALCLLNPSEDKESTIP